MRIDLSEKIRQKPSGLKPWRGRVRLRNNIKFHRRLSWTRKRWQRYVDDREEKRNARPLPRARKVLRLAEIARREDSAARSERMRAYHARRCAEREAS